MNKFDATIVPKELIEKIRNAKHLVVLMGAGISAESGIPIFLGETEISKTHNAKKLGHKGQYC